MSLYQPQNPQEQGYYSYLWSVALGNVTVTKDTEYASLSGKNAVQFFQLSGKMRKRLSNYDSLSFL